MSHLPRTSLSDPTKRSANPTPIPRILVADNENAASSSIDLNIDIATESALEVESDNVFPPPPFSERIRKRSELRQKPVFTGREFELPVLPSLPEGPQTPALSLGSKDVELASRLPDTTTSSLRMEDDANSTAPVLSPAQKAQHRLKGRLHFFAVCYASAIQGWNDGSTGPLLPTIQRYHNVRTLRQSDSRY